MIKKESISSEFKKIQDEICIALEQADGNAIFLEDNWQHHTGGGGRSRIMQNGDVIEKGGVNFSAVEGPTSPELMQQLNITEQSNYFATGVSIVQHPHNPFVPIIHMNIRYFELSNGTWWFGGGIDLTPHYINHEDARWFHQQLKVVCDGFSDTFYPKFKPWADDYFFIKHRNETRGIGGIFFDHLQSEKYGMTKAEIFAFVCAVGRSFAPIYTELISRNKNKNFDETHKKWQMLRRGRYVEFNLVWDRGTKFGLETGGRTESILMSLPPVANWAYDYQAKPNSAEEETLNLLRKGVEWG